MRKGFIFTEDKIEIDVFFLKDHVPPELGWQLGHQIGDGTDKNPILVDEETGKALAEDLEDCCEQDVNDLDKVGGCCPVGHKGETGTTGYNSLYDAILDTVRTFKDSELNIASETAQEILAMSIERKVNNYYDKK
tara:strand:+ start:965 stop:1369 length:405 start_codon:yes stop_codon:yes gene_type:complete